MHQGLLAPQGLKLIVFVYLQLEELRQSHSSRDQESAQAAVLQETVMGLEEQLADKNRVTLFSRLDAFIDLCYLC